MAVVRKKELRKLDDKEIDKRVADMRLELAKQKASIKIGASITSPGRTRELRKAIAKSLTIKNERGNKEEEGDKRMKAAKPLAKENHLQARK